MGSPRVHELNVKRTSRHAQKRTSRRPTQPHVCMSSSQGVCRTCGRLMDAARFHEHGVQANPRGKIGVTKEFAMLDGIGTVRAAAPEEQLGFAPPGVAARFAKRPEGVYSYGFGKNGESIRRFPNATLGGAVTSTRIAAQRSREHHWVIDNRGGYPVVVRAFDPAGKTVYRVEEYAKTLTREPVRVEAKKKRTSRRAA